MSIFKGFVGTYDTKLKYDDFEFKIFKKANVEFSLIALILFNNLSSAFDKPIWATN